MTGINEENPAWEELIITLRHLTIALRRIAKQLDGKDWDD